MDEQLISALVDVDDFCKTFKVSWHTALKRQGLRTRIRCDGLVLSELSKNESRSEATHARLLNTLSFISGEFMEKTPNNFKGMWLGFDRNRICFAFFQAAMP